MALKLKPEYNNSLVKRGKVIFDSSKTTQTHYKTYSDNGFADLFYDDCTFTVGTLGQPEKEKKEEKSTKKDK